MNNGRVSLYRKVDRGHVLWKNYNAKLIMETTHCNSFIKRDLCISFPIEWYTSVIHSFCVIYIWIFGKKNEFMCIHIIVVYLGFAEDNRNYFCSMMFLRTSFYFFLSMFSYLPSFILICLNKVLYRSSFGAILLSSVKINF